MRYDSKVSIIVVNYNGGEELLRTLDSIKGSGIDVVVVDNGSKEGVVWDLKDLFPQFRFIFLPLNYGFAKAVNIAVEHVDKKYLYILNPDTVPDIEGLYKLVDFMESNKNVAVVSGYHITNTQKIPGARRFPWSIIQMSGILRRFFGYRRYMYADLLTVDEPCRVDSVTGTFMLIRRDAFLEVGGFDERYFLYMEDMDICRKLWDKNWEVWFYPVVLGVHIRGDTYRDMTFLKYHHLKSAFKYFMKWGNLFQKIFAFINILFALPLVFLKGVKFLYPPRRKFI